MIDERADRAGVGDGFGERAASEAAVAVRRDVLGPRFDARLGDRAQVGGLRGDGDSHARLVGDRLGRGGDVDRITRVRLEVHQDEHTRPFAAGSK